MGGVLCFRDKNNLPDKHLYNNDVFSCILKEEICEIFVCIDDSFVGHSCAVAEF